MDKLKKRIIKTRFYNGRNCRHTQVNKYISPRNLVFKDNMTDKNPKACIFHHYFLTLLLMISVYNNPEIFFIEKATPLYELGMYLATNKRKSTSWYTTK